MFVGKGKSIFEQRSFSTTTSRWDPTQYRKGVRKLRVALLRGSKAVVSLPRRLCSNVVDNARVVSAILVARGARSNKVKVETVTENSQRSKSDVLVAGTLAANSKEIALIPTRISFEAD